MALRTTTMTNGNQEIISLVTKNIVAKMINWL